MTMPTREQIAQEIDVQAFAIWNHNQGSVEYERRSKASQAKRQEVALEKADAILALFGAPDAAIQPRDEPEPYYDDTQDLMDRDMG